MAQVDIMELDNPQSSKRVVDEAELPTEAPRRIQALSEIVVNKIAAGEIIVAPVNALKEMLENSVDAGSTSVDILVKEGGLKLLQITDNGHGIEKDDMAILCERHTTSKLEKFEDLMSIGTYGFRGEALASISHIAHVRVTTKTEGSSCAWQAHYEDGKLKPPKPGQSAEPRPTAGRRGTQITVEDLFYNTPQRRRAFRSPSEEYAKILDMVTRYAIHCHGVAFSVKKHGESGVGFSISATAQTLDRIKQAHGAAVARELIEFECEDAKWGFKAMGHASNANYHVKKSQVLLFINHRLVESSTVRKALEQTYSMFLPKGGHPFIYLCLEIDPARVDVNVHPTKREVHFLNEDEIIDLVCSEIRTRLAQIDTSRTFKTQTLLPGVTPMTPLGARGTHPSTNLLLSDTPGDQTSIQTRPLSGATQKRPYENNLVRTDSKLRKITSMLPPSLTTATSTASNSGPTLPVGIKYHHTDREPVTVRLTSVKNLRAAVRESTHHGLTEIFASLTYVGLVDVSRRLAAMQSGVNLYLVDYGAVSNAFFYQIGLTDFSNFGSISLNPAPDLKALLSIGAQLEIELDPDSADLEKDAVVEKVYEQLYSRRDMLNEYFSLSISESGHIETIPLLLKNYMPSMAKLPTFLLRLGPFVDWTSEQECFHSFLVELASFYVPEKLPKLLKTQSKSNIGHEEDDPNDNGEPDTQDVGGDGDIDDDDDEEVMIKRRHTEIEYALEHVLFPAFRGKLLGTKGILTAVVEVANLKGLYRVFERC